MCIRNHGRILAAVYILSKDTESNPASNASRYQTLSFRAKSCFSEGVNWVSLSWSPKRTFTWQSCWSIICCPPHPRARPLYKILSNHEHAHNQQSTSGCSFWPKMQLAPPPQPIEPIFPLNRGQETLASCCMISSHSTFTPPTLVPKFGQRRTLRII